MDENGVVSTVFSTTQSITLVGSLLNPCPNEVSFETNSGCLLDPWTVVGDGSGEGRGCDDAITPWTVAPGGTLQDVVPMGTMQADTWTWLTGFMGQSATLTFVVQ